MILKNPLNKVNTKNDNLIEGLSSIEANQKLMRYGPNTLTSAKRISVLKILFDQFSDFMVLILIACTIVSSVIGDITESIAIVAIVVVNAILGFIQEFKTEKTLEALKNLAAPNAKVIRDGKLISIPAENIVPGDLITLEAGDKIPADSIITEAVSLQIDEALLTGESLPVEKIKGSNLTNLDLEDKRSKAYMGTVITNGRGKAKVYRTGMNTEMGKIASLIQDVEEEETPLQKRLEHLGKFIVYGCFIVCAIVSVSGILRGEELFAMLLSGISLAVAAVPEGLPAIVTIALALGVQRMLKRNALVRKLPAVETLGCASIICSDKTGTLTENKMTVREIYADNKLFQVGGGSRDIAGDIILNRSRIDLRKTPILMKAFEICILCNNAQLSKSCDFIKGPVSKITSIMPQPEKWDITGDPTEGALLVAAAKIGVTKERLEKEFFRIDELPFDSDRKCMSVICNNQKGESIVFTKGAPDILIKKCDYALINDKLIKLDTKLKEEILEANNKMAAKALRVIALAHKKVKSKPEDLIDVENELVFVGLIGMLDPPRVESFDAVRKCILAGIKPIMITGDHKITAAAIASEIGILPRSGLVLTGEELDKMTDQKLENSIGDVSVFARVSPKNKLRIVKCFKKLGHVVAMTGDGVNDAPAVKEADIGISMGITGTDVTKEASAMILLDDNFATIIAAVEEGRVIYNNIRKFIRYMLACNIGEVLTMFLGMLLGLPLPLLPIQILWVNLVTDGLPAIALGLEPADSDIMKRRPRRSNENIFSDGLLGIILLRGAMIGIFTLLVFISIFQINHSIPLARTCTFVTLVITQLIHVFECKSEKKSIFQISFFNNLYLIFSVICSLIMMLGVVYIDTFQVIFKTVALSSNEWLIILGFSALGPILSSFVTFRKNHK